jgi:hypothetical protein
MEKFLTVSPSTVKLKTSPLALLIDMAVVARAPIFELGDRPAGGIVLLRRVAILPGEDADINVALIDVAQAPL